MISPDAGHWPADETGDRSKSAAKMRAPITDGRQPEVRSRIRDHCDEFSFDRLSGAMLLDKKRMHLFVYHCVSRPNARSIAKSLFEAVRISNLA